MILVRAGQPALLPSRLEFSLASAPPDPQEHHPLCSAALRLACAISPREPWRHPVPAQPSLLECGQGGIHGERAPLGCPLQSLQRPAARLPLGRSCALAPAVLRSRETAASPPRPSARRSSPCACSRSPAPSSHRVRRVRAHQTCFLAKLQDFEEERFQCLQVDEPKLVDRREVGMTFSSQHPEWNVFVGRPRDPPRRIDAGAVGVQKQRDHHSRRVRSLASRVLGLDRDLDRAQLYPIDDVQDEVREMIFWEPLERGRREQERSSRSPRTVLLRHETMGSSPGGAAGERRGSVSLYRGRGRR